MIPKIIEHPKIYDKRGNPSFFQHPSNLPFQIKRTYWIYDVSRGESRGSHTFKEQQEFIIALSGSFDVIIHDVKEEKTLSLNRPYDSLYVPKMYRRKLQNFSTNSLALIVSNQPYNGEEFKNRSHEK